MPLYDFECECGKREEWLVGREVQDVPCPCGGVMRRRFPYRMHLINSTQTYQRRTYENRQTIGQKFRNDPQSLAILRARARARGITLNENDAYMDCLGRHSLDPEAIVPHDDPLGYIRRLSLKRGHACEGMVNVKAVERDPKPPKGPGLAEDIIQDLMRQRAEKDPLAVSTQAKRKKLREDVINQHAPKPS